MQDKEDDRGWFLQQAACRKIRFRAYCSPLGFSVLKVSFEDRLVQLYVAGPYQSIQHCSESVSFRRILPSPIHHRWPFTHQNPPCILKPSRGPLNPPNPIVGT